MKYLSIDEIKATCGGEEKGGCYCNSQIMDNTNDITIESCRNLCCNNKIYTEWKYIDLIENETTRGNCEEQVSNYKTFASFLAGISSLFLYGYIAYKFK